MKLEVLECLAKEINDKIPPLLFIHGAYHGAWCWEKYFLPYFSSRGFSSYALSLRGHGKSQGYEQLHTSSLTDYVEDILETMLLFKRKPVLIGHSMGGALVQKILHLHPEKIRAAVLMASVPPKGMLKESLQMTLKRMFDRNSNTNFLAKLFFSDQLPDEEKEEFMKCLQGESTKARKELRGRIVPKSITASIPTLVIGSKTDGVFSEKKANSIGSAYSTTPVVFSNMSHDMMLDPNWKIVADQIVNFLCKEIPECREREKEWINRDLIKSRPLQVM
jgi:pimeloyl-ACP methyl ester carboxylesterase